MDNILIYPLRIHILIQPRVDFIICRFINADVYACTGQSVLGYNMFAYCLNNPVNFIDTSGERAQALAKIWVQSMGWLVLADGPIPLGDIIYIGVTVFLVGTSVVLNGKVIKKINTAKKTNAKKKKTSKKSGKEAADDAPSWAKQQTYNSKKTADQNATDVLNKKYGKGNWSKGPKTEYNQIKKWLQRSKGYR